MTETDKERITVICRPARESDTADMLEITKDLWDGQDYVPQMWAEWLADPVGALLAAEFEGRVIGVGKLLRLSEQDWWLQGLRVHPEYAGRGVASQLHYALLNEWERRGTGTLRLFTFRPQVRHLCRESGFSEIGEYSYFSASGGGPNEPAGGPAAAPPSHEVPTLPFRPLAVNECAEAAAYAADNPAREVLGDLLDLNWQRVSPQVQFLETMVENGLAWWWRGRQGLVTAYEDKEDDEEKMVPYISLLVCPVDSITPLLQDFLRLAAALDYPRVGWHAPLQPELLPCLQAAGFARTWDGSVFIYAKANA